MHYLSRICLISALICLCSAANSASVRAAETVAICYSRPDPIAPEKDAHNAGQAAGVDKGNGYALGIFQLEGDKIVGRHVFEAKQYLSACFDSTGRRVILVEGEYAAKQCIVHIINAESGVEEKAFVLKDFCQGMSRYKNPIPQSVGASQNLVRLNDNHFAVIGIRPDVKDEIKVVERNGVKNEYHISPPSCVVMFNLDGEVSRKEFTNFRALYPHFVSGLAVDNKVLLVGVMMPDSWDDEGYGNVVAHATYNFLHMDVLPVKLPLQGKETWYGALNLSKEGTIYGYGKKRNAAEGTADAFTRFDWQGKVLSIKELKGSGPIKLFSEYLMFPDDVTAGNSIPCFVCLDAMGNNPRNRAAPALLNTEAGTIARGDLSMTALIRKLVAGQDSNGNTTLYLADAGEMKFTDSKPDVGRTPCIKAITFPGMKVREVDFAVKNAAAYDVVAAPSASPAK